jgi:hypothetical protein
MHQLVQDKKCGKCEGRPVAGHTGKGEEFVVGKGENTKEKGGQLGESKREAFQFSGFDIFTLEEAGIGVTCAAREGGLRMTCGNGNFFQSESDEGEGLLPLGGRGRVMGKKRIANGYTTEVKAENLRAGRTQGVDDLKASSAEIDVKARASGAG